MSIKHYSTEELAEEITKRERNSRNVKAIRELLIDISSLTKTTYVINREDIGEGDYEVTLKIVNVPHSRP